MNFLPGQLLGLIAHKLHSLHENAVFKKCLTLNFVALKEKIVCFKLSNSHTQFHMTDVTRLLLILICCCSLVQFKTEFKKYLRYR